MSLLGPARIMLMIMFFCRGQPGYVTNEVGPVVVSGFALARHRCLKWLDPCCKELV